MIQRCNTSWLSRLASWNFKLTPEIEHEVDEMTTLVTDYYFGKHNQPEAYPGNIMHPYTNDKFQFNLVIFPTHQSGKELAVTNIQRNTLNFFPYNIDTVVTDRQRIYNTFRTTIQHEMVHLLDPKMRLREKEPTPGSRQYYSQPVEFDAYSKQIIEDMRQRLTSDPSLKNELEQWLRSSSIVAIGPLSAWSMILSHWAETDKAEHTDYMKRFKTRLFNELFIQRSTA